MQRPISPHFRLREPRPSRAGVRGPAQSALFTDRSSVARIVTETFFLPAEVARTKWAVPAEIYNLARSLLGRSPTGNLFVPIRSMQFLAVVTSGEVVFVDSQSYAVAQDEGGRLILIAWKLSPARDRQALGDPVPCEVVFYEQHKRDLLLRLVQEFRKAMELMDQRYRDRQLPAKGAKILPLHG